MMNKELHPEHVFKYCLIGYIVSQRLKNKNPIINEITELANGFSRNFKPEDYYKRDTLYEFEYEYLKNNLTVMSKEHLGYDQIFHPLLIKEPIPPLKEFIKSFDTFIDSMLKFGSL